MKELLSIILVGGFLILALAAKRAAKKVNEYGTNKHKAPDYKPNRHGFP